MNNNPVIDLMLNRKSVRKYKKKEISQEIIETIARTGQQAPFAYQCTTLLFERNKKTIPFKAPLLFTICVDFYRIALIMKKRHWDVITNDLFLLILGMQDAAYTAENMVIAAESLGLGSCFLGETPLKADSIKKKYSLPQRVFPLVQLVMGYPDEAPPPRPRYPLKTFLFEEHYPDLTDDIIQKAMDIMDKGYLAQNYYKNIQYRIPLENRQETFSYDNYSWTEHISRKLGQWFPSSDKILKELKKCGFNI